MTTYAADYAEQVMYRGRSGMEPFDFVPDWLDRPRKQKFYPEAVRVSLPGRSAAEHDTGRAFTANVGGQLRDDLDDIGAMLQFSYGVIGRRLGIQANSDLGGLPRYADAGWSRGTASGGGLYPISIYYVAGCESSLGAGVYHYSPMHHAFHQLLAGDVTGRVAAALTDEAQQDASGYFVLGLKYWQNAFKYNSFSFHAVTMDLGTVLATWTMWARSTGQQLAADLWFDEARIAQVLGVDNDKEGIYAVVPLRGASDSRVPTAAATPEGRTPQVRLADEECSVRTFGFEAVERMQRDGAAQTALDDTGRQGLEAITAPRRKTGEVVRLPDAATVSGSLTQALSDRRSSFGRFLGRELPAEQLHAMLRAAALDGLHTDALRDTSALASTYVLVNHVAGVAPGAYQFDSAAGTLTRVVDGDQGLFLQENYFLANYNLEQAAAVIVPAVPTHQVLGAVGPRGYRLANAAVGAISQRTYTAASALGIGCGVALGFDNVSFIEHLGLADTGEKPLLVMAVGLEYEALGDFRAEMA